MPLPKLFDIALHDIGVGITQCSAEVRSPIVPIPKLSAIVHDDEAGMVFPNDGNGDFERSVGHTGKEPS
jgi:hypothetical protein